MVVAFVIDEDPGFIFQAPKSICVQDTVPVALKNRAIIRFILWLFSAFAVLAANGIRCQELLF